MMLLGVRTEHGKGGARPSPLGHPKAVGTVSPALSFPSPRWDRARACAGVPSRCQGGSSKQGGVKRLISIHLPVPNLPPAALVPHCLQPPLICSPPASGGSEPGLLAVHTPHGIGATERLPWCGEHGRQGHMVGETGLTVPISGFNPCAAAAVVGGHEPGDTVPLPSCPCPHPTRHEHPLAVAGDGSVPRSLWGTRLPSGLPGDGSSSETLGVKWSRKCLLRHVARISAKWPYYDNCAKL